MSYQKILDLLGNEQESLLNHTCKTIPKEQLHLPSPDFLDNIFAPSSRSPQVMRSLAQLFGNGRLAGTGYLSILPIDQGIEHSAGASFAKNPIYFDPENIIKLAIEGGCNAVATTFGGLSLLSRKYAHKVPFIVKINHNELLTYPNKFDQVMFGSVHDAWELGAVAVGAPSTSAPTNHPQIVEVAQAFEEARSLGLAPSCGATPATTPSRRTAWTTTWRPT
jgi:class I fructose-bisphosphate aldolase